MSKYFAITYDGYNDLLTPVMDGAQIAMFSSVAAAEAAVAATQTPTEAGYVPSVYVYDASKHEVPVPLVAPGTPVLVNGQWVVSA